MRCRVDGCERETRYKAAQLCQKHYFRLWRNGSFDLKRSRVYRVTMPGKGYQRLYEPNHPLAAKDGVVSEHRMIVFAKYGWELPGCELCGKAVDWTTVHIDHKDRDVKNNAPDNLRPLCRVCNTFRDYPKQHTFAGRYAITWDGETKTPEEWARDPRINLLGSTIRHRKHRGMPDYDCLFAPKITHNGSVEHKNRRHEYDERYRAKKASRLAL